MKKNSFFKKLQNFFVIVSILLLSHTGWGQTTVPHTISATSGTIDSNISFSTAKNSSSTAPAFNTGDSTLRLYYAGASPYKGCSIILTPSNGATITKVEFNTFDTTYTPTVRYTIGASAMTASDPAASLSGTTYTISGLSVTSSINIRNANTSNTQLRITSITVTYTGGLSTPNLSISGATSHGSACVGTSTATQTYTITNIGNAVASGISVVSDDPQFVVSNISSTSISASGGTATYDVTFTPTSSGSKSANITVSSTTSGSNSPINNLTGTGLATVAGVVATQGASSITGTTATLNGSVTTLGVCPSTTEKGFVYCLTSDSSNPTVGGTGVTKQTVSGVSTGAYTYAWSGLTPTTSYTYRAYVYDGTTYIYGTAQTFTTLSPPANDLCVNATVITIDATAISGTLAGSSFTTPFTSNKDVWYSFTPTCSGNHVIVTTGFTGDVDIYLFGTSCPTNTTSLASSTTSTATETITYNCTAGTTYYIRVKAFDAAAETSSFTIKVNSPTPATAVVVSNAVSALSGVSATLNGSVTTLGVCPNTTEKGFVYCLTSISSNPSIGDAGVTSQTVSGVSTGAYTYAWSGLTPTTSYTYRAYVYDGTTYTYGTAQTFTTLSAEPTTQPTNLVRTAVTDVTMTVSWTAATSNPDGYIVVRSLGTSAPSVDPVDGTAYTVGTVLATNQIVAYVGSSLSAAMSSLTAATAYSFKVYSYNGSGTTINYLQNSPSPLTATSLYTLSTEPTNHSNVFSLNTYGPSSVTLNVQTLSTLVGNGYIILYKSGTSAPTTLPTDGQIFDTSGDAIFGANTTNNTIGTMQVTGLAQGSTYTFLLIPYNRASSNDATRNYKIDGSIPTFTFTLPNYNSSVTPVVGSEPATISSLINDPAPLTNSTGKEVWKFTINDGASDTDGLPTKVSDITIAKSGTSGVIDFLGSIKTAALFDSTGNFVATASSITATSLVFSGLSIVVPNQSSATYSLRISLKETITNNPNIEGKDFGFSISNTNISAPTDGTSSRFSTFSAAQSAQSKIVVDVTASSLVFTVQPQAVTWVNAVMNAVTVSGVDVNGNVDADYTATITLTSTGTLSGTTAVAATQGVAVFSTLSHTVSGVNFSLTATAGSLSVTSTLFDILGAPTALDASNIQNTSFTAHWNSEISAKNGYQLEVSTSPTFDNVVFLNENFSLMTVNGGTTPLASTINSYTQTSGWSAANIYEMNGYAKLGSGSALGSITTPTLDLSVNGGNSVLSFDLQKYNTDATIVQVLHAPNGTNFTQVGLDITPTVDFVTYQVNITGGTANSKIKIQAKNAANNRYYLDNVKVSYSSLLPNYNPKIITSQGTTNETVTGLTEATTYYYRLRAVDNGTVSAYSNIKPVTTGPLIWLGTTSNAWSTASNWSHNKVPDGTMDIKIPTGTPVLDTNFTLPAGKQLSITGTGSLTMSPSSVLTLAGTADFGGKPVTLQSDATGTATIAEITGTLNGATNVTVERYIPAKRAWRALTAPLKGSNGSLYATWQNNGTTVSGTGVSIWGPSGTNIETGPNYSVLNYTATGWVGVNNTSTSTLFDSTKNNAYLVFVTGPYGSNNIATNTAATATTLKATGQLITGTVNYSNIIDTKHTLIGNPYASALTPSTLLDGGTNLITNFWVWDPNVGTTGGYNMYDDVLNQYSSNTGSYPTNTTAIQSGQAFFVRATTGNTGSFSLLESKKSTAVSNVFGRTQNTSTPATVDASIFRVGMYKETTEGWKGADGAIVGIYATASNDVNDSDGKKMANGSENIAFVRNNTTLSSEHHAPIQAQDELYMRVWNTSAANYKLKINTENFADTTLEATLIDLFTGTQTPLMLDGSVVEYPFAVTSNTASTGDRFKVVFQNSALGVHTSTSASLKLYPNPATSGMVQVQLPEGDYSHCSYEVVNGLGQIVAQSKVPTDSSHLFSINTASLASSWYVVRIVENGKTIYQTKLIVKN